MPAGELVRVLLGAARRVGDPHPGEQLDGGSPRGLAPEAAVQLAAPRRSGRRSGTPGSARSSAPGRSCRSRRRGCGACPRRRAPRRSRPRSRAARPSTRPVGSSEAQQRERGHRLPAARLADEGERLAGARGASDDAAHGGQLALVRPRRRRAGRDLEERRRRSPAPPQPRVQASRRPSPTRLKASTTTKIAKPGTRNEPGRVEQVAASVGQDVAPGGEGRLHAEAEEAERRLGEDRARPRRSWPRPAPARSRSAACGGR